mgnify:CR=1 FL=1
MLLIVATSTENPELMWACDTEAHSSENVYRDRRLIIIYKGYQYDRNGWPSVSGKNRLSNQVRAKLPMSMEDAHKAMLSLLAGNPVPTKPSDNESNASESDSSSVVFSGFEKILADSLAKATAEQVYDSILPELKRKVYEEIGVIPRKIVIETPEYEYSTTSVLHEMFENVFKLVHAGIPVFLTGPAGSGKNHLAMDVANAMKIDFRFNNALTSEYALTGFIDANGRLHETEFRRAWVNGGLWFGDEIDASTPEVAVKLNAALSNGYAEFPDGTHKIHENTRIIVAGNTFGTGGDIEYTGRFQLDAATLDRFAIVHIDYDKNVEIAISGGNMDIVEFIRDLRNAISKAGIRHVVSYRALYRLTRMLDVMPDEQVLSQCVLKNLERDDLRVIHGGLSDRENRFAKVLATMAGV